MVALQLAASGGMETIEFEPRRLVIAGWTGRDRATLEAHIRELEELGVKAPRSVPLFYCVDHALLSWRATIPVVGRDSTGEAEVVIYKQGGRLLVGLGSDHTDRALETVGITLSKQVCAKPVSPQVWAWDDVSEHWDDLQLTSSVPRGAEFYQRGSVASLRRPDELLALYEQQNGVAPDGFVMFCGTLPVNGGIRFADRFSAALGDPKLDRELRLTYDIVALTVAEA